MTVVPEEDSTHKPLRIGVLPEFFTSEEEIPYALRRDSDEFDYGYALTVHKAQGSQWDNVVLFDESGAFRDHRARWLYTAVTRAAESFNRRALAALSCVRIRASWTSNADEPMKSILIPVEAHAGMSAVLETARLLARKFDSYIEGVALGPDLTQIVAADFSVDGIVFDDTVRRDIFDEARATFETFMRDSGIPLHGAPSGENAPAPSYGWVRNGLVSDNGVGEYGRVFDIIAVGRPGPGARTAAQIDTRIGADRERPSAPDRSAPRAEPSRRDHRHCLEPQF